MESIRGLTIEPEIHCSEGALAIISVQSLVKLKFGKIYSR